MQKNKKWRSWIKKINEKELSQLLGSKEKNYKLDENTDKETFNMIKSFDPDNEKSKAPKELIVLKKPFFNYSLAAVMTVFLILMASLIIGQLKRKYQDINNNCIITKLDGDVALKDRRKNTEKKLELNDILNKNSTIKTSANSSAQISFYNRSQSLITERSELSVLLLNKKEETEQIILKIESGSGIFIPAKIEGSSVFDVYTDAAVIRTTGTEFTVDVAENKDSKVIVFEGKVNVSLNINRDIISNIKRINNELGTKLETELTKGETIIKDRQILVSYNNVKAVEEKLLEIYDRLKNYEMLKPDEKNIADEKNRQPAKEIESIIKGSLTIENANLNLIEKKIKIKRLLKNPGIKLTEKFTSFFTDNKNLYIAGDSYRGIYCISKEDGSIIWEFLDEHLKTITAPGIFFNGRLINAGPKYIFIINKNGSPYLIQEINKGPSFWAAPITVNNKVLIPGFEDILVYEETGFSTLKNFSKSLGQLYISAADNKLFCTYSTSQKISIYDLEKEVHTWTSNILNNNVFMAPLVVGDNIYFADDTDGFYKYNYRNNRQEKIFTGTGVISNLMLRDNYIYFIANNGFFYRLNILSFKKADMLFKVDNNPYPDKYLTKKILYHNDEIYFSSDTGKLFKYDIINEQSELIHIDDNKSDLPLTASPVAINDAVYVIDVSSNIYRINY